MSTDVNSSVSEVSCPEIQDPSLHDLGRGLHWDEMRRAMVTECRKCGRIFWLAPYERETGDD